MGFFFFICRRQKPKVAVLDIVSTINRLDRAEDTLVFFANTAEHKHAVLNCMYIPLYNPINVFVTYVCILKYAADHLIEA